MQYLSTCSTILVLLKFRAAELVVAELQTGKVKLTIVWAPYRTAKSFQKRTASGHTVRCGVVATGILDRVVTYCNNEKCAKWKSTILRIKFHSKRSYPLCLETIISTILDRKAPAQKKNDCLKIATIRPYFSFAQICTVTSKNRVRKTCWRTVNFMYIFFCNLYCAKKTR